MERTKLSKIIDIISLTISIFILSFWILNKFTLDKIFIIMISSFISILLTCSTLKLISVKNKIQSTKTTKKKKLESVNLSLKFGDSQKIKQFWIKLFSKNYKVTDNNTYLILNNNSKTIHFYYNFTKNEILLEDLVQIIIDTNHTPIFFCGNSFSTDALVFANYKKNLNLLDINATFSLFDKYHLFPTIKDHPKTKKSILQKFYSTVNNQNTLKYFKYSLILLLLGIIFTKNIIYISFSVFLLLIAIISLTKKPIINNSNLDI